MLQKWLQIWIFHVRGGCVYLAHMFGSHRGASGKICCVFACMCVFPSAQFPLLLTFAWFHTWWVIQCEAQVCVLPSVLSGCFIKLVGSEVLKIICLSMCSSVHVLLQFTELGMFETVWQVKYYNYNKRDHCQWGNSFNSIEYECKPNDTHTLMWVNKEMFVWWRNQRCAVCTPQHIGRNRGVALLSVMIKWGRVLSLCAVKGCLSFSYCLLIAFRSPPILRTVWKDKATLFSSIVYCYIKTWDLLPNATWNYCRI